MVVKFLHRFGLPMFLDTSFEYQIINESYNQQTITKITGTIQRNPNREFTSDVTYSNESADDLLNRIASEKFNNKFEEKLK